MSKKLLFVIGVACLAIAAFTAPVHAQYGSLPVGSLGALVASNACSASGWFSYGNSNMICFHTTVQNCPNASNLGLTFGYIDPVGIINGVSKEKGVIVLLGGDGGTAPANDNVGNAGGDNAFALYYFGQGYEIVELAWDSDWQFVTYPLPPSGNGNIQFAACHPATFLYWVFQNIYYPIQSGQNGNSHAGMCEHGFSAGTAAIAYTLAYYGPPSGQKWWVDNTELLSGPVLSDIKQGCQVPVGQNVTICGTNSGNCQLGSDPAWQLTPAFEPPSNTWVEGWTGNTTCANTQGVTTSPTSNAQWLAQSIVDDGTNNPVFNYPSTKMAGWLCYNVKNQNQCNYQHYDWNVCPNESSPQGQLFYQAVTSNYAIWAVNQCTGSEGVGGGKLGSDTGPPAVTQIDYDMAGGPGNNPPANCSH